MADSLFNVHSLSDSASNIDTMEEDHGLMPRKDNYKNYKNSQRKRNVDNTRPARPVIHSGSKQPILDSPAGPSMKRKSKTSNDDLSIANINKKLNSLISLVCENQEPESDTESLEDMEEGQLVDSDEDLDYFKSISSVTTKKGPTINTDLAMGISTILQSGLKSAAKDTITELYTCPENCRRMEIVICNPEILNSASSATKKSEERACEMQGDIMKGLMASATAYNNLITIVKQETINKQDIKATIKSLANAISMQAHVSHSVDINRRFNFKQDIKAEFASLCSDAYPVENHLFGNELQEKIKSVNEATKLKLSVNSNKKHHPYKAGSQAKNAFFGRGSFGRGGSQYSGGNKYSNNRFQSGHQGRQRQSYQNSYKDSYQNNPYPQRQSKSTYNNQQQRSNKKFQKK